MNRFLLIWGIVAVGWLDPCSAQNDIYYRLEANRLECLLEHAEAYLEIENDPLDIAVYHCPEILKNPATAAFTSQDPDPPPTVGPGTDKLITLYKKELRCLMSFSVVEFDLSSTYRIFRCRAKLRENDIMVSKDLLDALFKTIAACIGVF